MAYTLVGTVVSSCDTVGDFSTLNGGANISGDDDNVEGTGAIGDKMSATTEVLASNNLSGGAAGVYDFSSGGADEGKHFIGWINTKTPVNSTSGIKVYFANSAGHLGRWNVMPASFYKGGFITRVINPEKDFSSASTWTTTGNPAQLDDVSVMGFEFTTITSLMGNFNNTQVDQFTVGTGIRADAGTIGTPNTFEGVRVADEDTAFWGWWSSSNGAFIGKGKLYIGPSTGTATSVFTDTAFKVIFADEQVAVGFYEIQIRGTNTDVTFELASISAANAANARWGLTVDSTTNTFSDTNGVWTGADAIVLNANSDLLGTTLIDCTSLVTNSASMDGVTVLNSNTATGVAFITSDSPAEFVNCTFDFSAGHAIEFTTAGTFSFDTNVFTGSWGGTAGSNLVAASGSNDAMVYNNSGGLITLNIIGSGSNVSIRNGAGATTEVNLSVGISVNGVTEGTRCAIIGSGGAEDGVVLLEGYADSTGTLSGSFSGTVPQDVTIIARNAGIISALISYDGGIFTDYTNEAREQVGGDDVLLLPAVPAVGDAAIFGGINKFGKLLLKISTAGTGGYVAGWEYWNGTAWTSLSVTDNTNVFKIAGWNEISFNIPSDWALTTLNGQGPYYYIRLDVTTGGGTGAFAEYSTLNNTVKYQPFRGSGTILTGSGLSAVAVWIEDSNNP